MRGILPVFVLTLPWVQNVTFGPSNAVVQSVLCWSCWALFGLLCCGSKTPQRQLQTNIVNAWGLAALLSACIGLLQYFGFANGLQGLASAADVGQAYGNLHQRNQFATLLSMGLLALLWHAATASAECIGSTEPTPARVWALYMFAALLAAANVASGSRTGMLQWLLVAGMFWFWAIPNRQPLVRPLVCVSLLAYLLAAIAFPLLLQKGFLGSGILSRILEASPACTSRITLWNNVLQLIAQKPLMGWGWGELDYAHFVTPLAGLRFCGIVDNAHNLPLQLAVEGGLPLAVLLCALLGGVVFYAKPWRESMPMRQVAWGVLAVIGLHSFLEYPLWYAPFQGALLSAVYLLCFQTTGLPTNNQRIRMGLLSAGLLVGSILVTFDYWRMSQIYMPLSSRARMFENDTLQKAKESWLFKDLAVFAELTTTALQRDNAEQVHAMALKVVHLSPEPRVIEYLIESAVMLGKDEEAMFYLARYKVAFPAESARWRAKL